VQCRLCTIGTKYIIFDCQLWTIVSTLLHMHQYRITFVNIASRESHRMHNSKHFQSRRIKIICHSFNFHCLCEIIFIRENLFWNLNYWKVVKHFEQYVRILSGPLAKFRFRWKLKELENFNFAPIFHSIKNIHDDH